MGSKRKSLDELLDTSEVKDFLFRAERELFPRMKESRVSLTIYSGAADAKLAIELGAAILLDKPLLILALRGVPLPPRLRAVATEVIEVEGINDPGAGDKIQAALRRVMGSASPVEVERG